AAVCALAQAAEAAAAFLGGDGGLAAGVLFFFAGARTAAHADVLYRAAETRDLVSLEMVEADEDIGIHYGAADARLFDIFAALHRNGNVVCAFEAVCDYHGAAGRQGRETVFPGALKVLQRIFALAGIECVAVGEEWAAAELFYEI